MIFYVIDDEPFALRISHQVIQEAFPNAQVLPFGDAAEALDAIGAGKQIPDVVFCDIEMPRLNGLEFAVRLKTLSPQTRVIFVTGYSQYALEAFRIHAHGYILKPMSVDRVREECAALDLPGDEAAEDKLQVKCFGYFEAFWHGKPLDFSRKQTKELFAYLINRHGDACTAEEIAAAIWEDEGDLIKLKTRVRVLISDLRKTLSAIGMEHVIIRGSGRIAVRTDLLACDYYRLLSGDAEAVNAFHGEYMTQYSWAEMTVGHLMFRSRRRRAT